MIRMSECRPLAYLSFENVSITDGQPNVSTVFDVVTCSAGLILYLRTVKQMELHSLPSRACTKEKLDTGPDAPRGRQSCRRAALHLPSLSCLLCMNALAGCP